MNSARFGLYFVQFHENSTKKFKSEVSDNRGAPVNVRNSVSPEFPRLSRHEMIRERFQPPEDDFGQFQKQVEARMGENQLIFLAR